MVTILTSIGCACDIPAHCYTYSFEPNTEWSAFYSGHAEIQDYFVRFYHKHQLEPFVRLNHKVLSTVWDDDQGICKLALFQYATRFAKYVLLISSLPQGNVEIEHDGQVVHDWCHVLVNGAGVVNRWKCEFISETRAFLRIGILTTALGPAIEGLHDFKGQLAHSAAWDETIDTTGKKVAVIGTGSSSIQMVPQLAKGECATKIFEPTINHIPRC